MVRIRSIVRVCLLGAAVSACDSDHPSGGDVRALGDQPTIASHVSQADVDSGKVSTDDLVAAGRALFAANFNTLDGAGRPEATGTGAPRPRREAPENFNRVSAPDANSCAGCHNVPFLGGGGDNVANVFVLGQQFPFVNFDEGPGDDGLLHFLDDVANERNTLGMFGAGFIELIAREMTADLQATRALALAQAQAGGAPVTLPLDTKGVNFGSITGNPDGTVDTTGVDGCDADLVVRPFHQKGVVVSLRQFTNNAYPHHHGMQSEERFGTGVDHDVDGHADELTVGDVTAATIFQATLPAPGRVIPVATADGPDPVASIANGEALFDSIGCTSCHVPFLVLEDPVFTEPSPYNPSGNLQLGQVPQPFAVDLTAEGPGPHLPREADGTVLVRAYTDFKRHDMGPFCDNEKVVQGGVPTNEFITRKLWGFANEPPYLHNGRALTISEAVLFHGGEAQAARDAFAALSGTDQADVVEFLKTLQVLPPDAPSNTVTGPSSGILGDEPAIVTHVSQADIDAGLHSPETLFAVGKVLFDAKFNTLDGAGRPETTGTGASRPPRTFPENFNRVSAPDANSCAGCHNVPRGGGGGDNVANVFVLGQKFPFVNFDGLDGDDFQDLHLDTVANERNTLGMFGSGFIELLAREMSSELIAIRTVASTQAQAGGAAVTASLDTKGVNFGSIVANPDGTFDTTGVSGVNADLIVRPFHQKGVVVSLREFTNNAMNHHHGMQTEERFGTGVDFDNDTYVDELTVGDVTSTTIYQAMLPVPGRSLPADAAVMASVTRGESLFGSLGCSSCHVPELVLDDPVFTEPSPFNPAGNLVPSDVPQPFGVDLTVHGIGPRLPREPNGTVRVPAFTDLKRHDMGIGLDNEKVVQGGVPTNEFITRKLWGTANEPPFMHHGRALTLDEAILMHGGEAQAARDAYEGLPAGQRASVVDFLRTLQVLPENSPLVVIE